MSEEFNEVKEFGAIVFCQAEISAKNEHENEDNNNGDDVEARMLGILWPEACFHCEQFYPNQLALSIHLAKTHAQVFEHWCSSCGFRTNKLENKAKHLEVAHDGYLMWSPPPSLTVSKKMTKNSQGSSGNKQTSILDFFGKK